MLVLSLLLLVPARADEIVLTNGRRLSCEIVEETATAVRVRLPHGRMTIPRSKIRVIEREGRGRWLEREARASLRRGSTRSAVELYARALADRPDDARLLARYARTLEKHARVLAEAYRFAEARRIVEEWRRVDPAQGGDGGAAAALLESIGREERRAASLLARADELARDGRYRRALTYYDQWRLRRPVDDPKARARMAAAHLGAGAAAVEANHLRLALDHFRAARAFGEHARSAEPLFLLAPVAVLEALREGDVEAARRHLDRIATTYPHPAVPAYLKAVLAHVTGRVGEAVEAYAAAARIAEAGGGDRGISYDLARAYATATLRAAIARPPQEGVRKWRELFLASLVRDEGRHFVVYAPTAKTAAQVAETADRVYAELCRELLGAVPDAPLAEIVAHPSRQAYLAADPDPPGTDLAHVTIDRAKTSGVAYDTLDEEGAPLVRVELIAGGPGWLESTLPHELVHVVQRRGLRAFRRGKWLDEGLAMLHEGDESRANRLGMWRTMASAAIPLPEFLALRSIPPDKVGLFYQQAHAFTTFLRGLGDATEWRTFLDRFGADGDLASAAKAAWKVESAEALERAWRTTMRTLR